MCNCHLYHLYNCYSYSVKGAVSLSGPPFVHYNGVEWGGGGERGEEMNGEQIIT